MADVRLVEGVAADDLEPVAGSVNPHRQEATSVENLARHVHGEIPTRSGSRVVVQPPVHGGELEILVELPRPVNHRTAHAASGKTLISNECSK
jgi:hypothetical protein